MDVGSVRLCFELDWKVGLIGLDCGMSLLYVGINPLLQSEYENDSS